MNYIRQKLQHIWQHSRIEFLVFLGAALVAGLFSLYISSLGLTKLLVDQNAHLNIARLISDSLTPGISQIGFWPPLIHIVMAPFASVSFLFETGLAGAAALVPVFALGAVFVYRILRQLTDSQFVSLGGVLVYLTNPYLLYYTATPMTETLFVVTLLGVAYYFLRWLDKSDFRSLIYLGIFVALAGMARFEGFALLPIVLTLIVVKLYRDKKSYHEIEAISILFGLIALIGLGFVFVYSFVFGGNPLEFLNGAWSAAAQQESFYLPTAGDVGMSLLYLIEASKYLLGGFLVSLSLLGFIYLLASLLFDKRLFPFFGISAVLLSPFFFDIFALTQGTAILYVDTLPPFDGYFNERYGIYWLGFAVIVPMFMIELLNERIRAKFATLKNTAAILLVSFVVGTNAAFLGNTVFADNFATLAASSQGTLPGDQRELGHVLGENYDEGKILITRGLQNYVTVEAGIPLKNYLLESNFLFYENAIEAPWFFAKWVVMYNPEIEGIEEWRRAHERVSQVWADSSEFEQYYTLVFENGSERLYRLKEDEVLRVARTFGIDTKMIPSLNSDIHRWNLEYAEEEILAHMKEERSRDIAVHTK